jgi:SMEK domain
MSRPELTTRCQQVLAWLASQVTIANVAGFSDINVVSESLMQNLFNLIEDGATYINTNLEAPNADSIDLADAARKIAVQITSTTTPRKIEKTLAGFTTHKRSKQYKKLHFLFLADRYRPTKKYSLKGTTITFEDLGRLRRVIELLEKELAPWVPYGKAYVDVIKEKATVTAESIRVECRMSNLGEFTAENIQMSVRPSISGHVSVIPKAEWNAIPGCGEVGSRTFQAEHAVHPKQSIRAIIDFTPDIRQPTFDTPAVSGTALLPTFHVRLSLNNSRAHFFDVAASD